MEGVLHDGHRVELHEARALLLVGAEVVAELEAEVRLPEGDVPAPADPPVAHVGPARVLDHPAVARDDVPGGEVDLPGGTYKEDGNNGQVLIAFLGKAAEKVIAIQKTVTIIFWVLVAVAVCVLIYIWYRLDARYEERQKLAAHGGREKDKKKHKN